MDSIITTVSIRAFNDVHFTESEAMLRLIYFLFNENGHFFIRKLLHRKLLAARKHLLYNNRHLLRELLLPV